MWNLGWLTWTCNIILTCGIEKHRKVNHKAWKNISYWQHTFQTFWLVPLVVTASFLTQEEIQHLVVPREPGPDVRLWQNVVYLPDLDVDIQTIDTGTCLRRQAPYLPHGLWFKLPKLCWGYMTFILRMLLLQRRKNKLIFIKTSIFKSSNHAMFHKYQLTY